MSPQDKPNDDTVDEDAELLALEKILAEADEQEEKQKSGSNETKKEDQKTKTNATPRLREDSTFADAFSYDVDTKLAKKAAKEVESRMEEVDSSDDEEVRNFLERKYNEYGSDVNKKLKQQNESSKDAKVEREVNAAIKKKNEEEEAAAKAKGTLDMHIKNPHNPIKRQGLITHSFTSKARTDEPLTDAQKKPTLLSSAQSSVYMDPVFGLRIIKPLVSSTLLQERMAGRQPVAFSAIAFHTERGDLTKDWVIGGVLTHKGNVQMTKKGKPYSIWRVSDLKGEIKTVSLFLFGGAHKELWKTVTGTCIAVLNPTIFEKRAENTDVACLSIDTAAKVMLLGQSKDLGACKSVKRNGEVCNALVNLSECDTCVFHMKQEFTKMSKRSELQSANAGRGLQDLRNKVLGKSEVFYGGQSYTALPARKSAKLTSKDNQRISNLSEYAVSPFAGAVNHASKPRLEPANVPYAIREGPISKIAGNVDASRKQRLKDLERLQILQAESARTGMSSPSTPSTPQSNKSKESVFSKQQTSTPTTSKQSSPSSSSPAAASTSMSSSLSSVPDKFKNREFSFNAKSPSLSSDNFSLEVNIGARRASLAKQKALEVLKKKPIQKIDPNNTRGTRDGKRRAIDDLNEKFMSNDAKKQKLDEEQREQDRKSRIQRIMDASSSHTNLIDMREREEQEKYFSKLEKKEALEEKMLSTYKMPCKAVICKTCKYTAFSAADRCKQERHPLKIVDAEKRFFQCKDCGNRTASVFRLPKNCCSNCNGSRWERCAMIRERKVANGPEALSLRGDEEMFIGSVSGKANLNLAVPED